MSGAQYTPYYSVPTADREDSIPSTYPPTTPPAGPTSASYQPPLPYSQHSHVPTSSASSTFPYSTDSPQSYKPLGLDHDFTADMKRPALDDPHRWSYSSASRPSGLRRFTKAWWKHYWRLQVSRRRMPRLLYALTGLILMAVWLGIATSFVMTLQSAESQNAQANLVNDKLSGAFNTNNVMFFMSGSLNSFDPDARNLNVDWSALMVQGPLIGGLGNASQVSVELFGPDPIAIFRDTVARPDLERAANVSGYVPYRLKAPGLKPIGFLGISDFDQINTDIGLSQQGPSILTSPSMAYPFGKSSFLFLYRFPTSRVFSRNFQGDLWGIPPLDIFTGNITFVAANNATITSSGRPGSDIMRINGAALQDAILGFKVQLISYPTCLDPDAPGCELTITITLQRTGLVKFCVVVVFVVGWIITIAIFLITGEALLLNRSNILEGTDILAICFTALFALPTVRSLLPNVPSSYGCLLDILGILPNVIIVTLCTTFFTNSRLRMRAHQAAQAAEEAKQQAKNA